LLFSASIDTNVTQYILGVIKKHWTVYKKGRNGDSGFHTYIAHTEYTPCILMSILFLFSNILLKFNRCRLVAIFLSTEWNTKCRTLTMLICMHFLFWEWRMIFNLNMSKLLSHTPGLCLWMIAHLAINMEFWDKLWLK